MAKETILLVGGCGFLGLHLIDQFWAKSPRPDIHVFDVRPLGKVSPNFYSFNPEKITVHIGDLTKAEDVIAVIKKCSPSVIVHSASPVHGLGANIYHKVNVDGTKNLLECAKKLKVPALVYTSSAGVLFNGADIYNADETYPFPEKPMDAYNLTKQLAEEMVLNADSPGFRTTAVRPAGIFGPGDRQMIPQIRLMAQRNQHRIQLGDNLNLFDVTYVGNVAYSHVLAAEKILDKATADQVGGECFLVTNDAPIYFWSLARAVWKQDGKFCLNPFVIPRSVGIALGYVSQYASKLLGKEATFTAFRVRTACAVRYYNITKAKTILGYKPQVELEEGIRRTLAYMDENPAQ